MEKGRSNPFTAPDPNRIDKPVEQPETQTTAALPSFSWLWSGFVIIPLVILIAFHVGAGYLSYQKYGSIGWAFLDFIFAYFYYPYYAFFLAKDPGPSMGMVGGKRGLMGALKKLMK
jgi:hypothetical protein